MANLKQLKFLRSDVYAWNRYRDENPNIEIDLTDADLTDADLTRANLLALRSHYGSLRI